MQSVKSTCPYCGVGCGLRVNIENSTANDKPAKTIVLGDEQHPANLGRLCSKGSALAETLVDQNSGERLTQATIAGSVVSWDTATQAIADKISSSIEEHGRDSVAFYLSGQLLTEDYYVANKLMKGFIGTANVDTNSRLCMASAVASYKRAFGSDTVPCSYDDIDAAELIVLIGSNAAWTHPVLYQRMVAAKQANPNLKVVLIDPRETASCDIADLHLAIKPSSDGFLFQGLLKYLIDTYSTDEVYIRNHTDGFIQARDVAEQLESDSLADQLAVDPSDLLLFFEWFAETKNVLSFYSQGINQSATGTDKCNAIINCHLATGKIGYQGAGPFSITGQPNAMGGREVGGLATQLAAHMDFDSEDRDRVQRFWRSPRIAQKAGLKAVDLFDAVSSGQIKVIWIMATNPAVSLPNSNKVRAALEKCPTVIVSDVINTDTTKYADILLPAQGWSEKDGTVTNSERCISRQRAFCAAPGEAKADWWALNQVGKKLGFDKHFNFENAHQIFIEHSKLSGFENNDSRAFDISGLSDMSAVDYDQLTPIQWPVNSLHPQGCKRMFSDAKFYTSNGRAKFISAQAVLANCVKQSDNISRPSSTTANSVTTNLVTANLVTANPSATFILNTGRLRDQWHTMTRTGHAPLLTAHDDVPLVQVNTLDAKIAGLKDNQLVALSNAHGELIATVKVGQQVKPGELFSAIHWNDQFATKAVVCSVLSSKVDPISGQPESKASSVHLQPYHCAHWARVASKHSLDKAAFEYWAETKTKRGYVTLLGCNGPIDWRSWSENQLSSEARMMQYSGAQDAAQAILASQQSSIELLVFSHKHVEQLPSYSWLSSSFDNNDVTALAYLLRSEDGYQDQQLCSCFGISKKTIQAVIKQGATSIDELGIRLGCGSKCGSCKPELSELLSAN
ncbi:MAG: assimilatory nitrate reductase catalytic subunit [Paracoccaceae bacterium]|jgi:assimilatory nitrate reductase catalytic subunit